MNAQYGEKVSRVVFTGDVFFGGVLEQKTVAIDFSSLTYDRLVINLEQSIYSDTRAHKGTLLSSEEALESGIKKLKPTHAGLANNHIHDGGLTRIADLKTKLESLGVVGFGAGRNKTSAETPVQLNGNLWLLGCCAVNKPTLNDIAVATSELPGLMAAEYEQLATVLEEHNGKDFIIYVHWSEEHIMLPHPYTRELAKRLLKHENVTAVIGMHPHIILPKELFYGKPVFYSLGNFLFPDFIIEPPTQLSKSTHYVSKTRSYHKVNTLTLKTWPLRNRTSLVLVFDSETLVFTESIFKQSLDSTIVAPAGRLLCSWVKFKYKLQSVLLYVLPNTGLYRGLYSALRRSTLLFRWSYIAFKLTGQFGVKHVCQKLKNMIR